MIDPRTRSRGRLVLAPRLVGLLLVAACTRESSDATSPGPTAEALVEKAEGTAPPAPSDLPPSSLGAGLDDALERAIVPPQAGGSSYRVDPFVAALAYAAAEREGARWFSPYVGTPAKIDYEVRGFAVTAAGERAGLLRLGLREGDIVEEVNGVAATDAATIRGALAGSDEGVTVGVFREDYSFVLGYRFESGLAWMRTREEGGIEAAAPAEVPAGDDAGAAPGGPEDAEDEGGAVARVGPKGTPSGGGAATPSGGGSRPSSGSTPRPSTPSTPKSTGGGSTPSASSQVSCSSDASCTIRKSYFDSMVSSPSKLESQAKIVPAIRNDVFSGYKLSWIRPGSAIDEMGFRAGDKITHVNGRDLTDDSQAFAVYLSLSSTRSYKIKYVRGSQSRTKTVDVK